MRSNLPYQKSVSLNSFFILRLGLKRNSFFYFRGNAKFVEWHFVISQISIFAQIITKNIFSRIFSRKYKLKQIFLWKYSRKSAKMLSKYIQKVVYMFDELLPSVPLFAINLKEKSKYVNFRTNCRHFSYITRNKHFILTLLVMQPVSIFRWDMF